MKSIRYECSLDDPAGFRADAVIGDTVFEVLVQTKDARRLRTTLMDLARILSGKQIRRAILILDEPQITEARLREEWEGAASVIRPELFSRLAVVLRQEGEISGIPVSPAEAERVAVSEILGHTADRHPRRTRRSSTAYYEILRLITYQWLVGKGPVAINWLTRNSGTSYPTVAKALDQLAHYLVRHSDRRVELRYFPKDEWARLLAVSDAVRSTIRFADRSGQPRSPESHLRRLEKLGIPNLAIGGVIGAKHYYPDLDLVGTPRLDLSMHCPNENMDVSFIEKLDPALQRVTDSHQPVSVAVHAVWRKNSFFETGEGSLSWADPVECLLDLHEARLESQAAEFLRYFENSRVRTP